MAFSHSLYSCGKLWHKLPGCCVLSLSYDGSWWRKCLVFLFHTDATSGYIEFVVDFFGGYWSYNLPAWECIRHDFTWRKHQNSSRYGTALRNFPQNYVSPEANLCKKIFMQDLINFVLWKLQGERAIWVQMLYVSAIFFTNNLSAWCLDLWKESWQMK